MLTIRPAAGMIARLWLACLALSLLAVTAGQAAPRGRQITFLAPRSDRPGIYLLDVDRGLLALFLQHPFGASIAQAAWSPRGDYLAFRVIFRINIDLYVMDWRGLDPRPITRDGMNNHAPAWSPDGQQLVFASEVEGSPDIYIMNAGCVSLPESCASHRRRLTDDRFNDDMPSWSPDGTQVVFHSNRDGNYEIYVMSADGGDLRRLTTHPQRDMLPAWSPDGQRIAFISDRDRNYELYIMDTDGGNLRRLTETGLHEFSPRWSPDGAQILFEAMATGGDFQTYLIEADGRNRRQLTTVSAGFSNPLWRP